MVKLNLEAQGTEQQAVLSYLQENVSEVLADKINNGVFILKDGKRLLNKKDLNGFMRYACDEARKQAAKGSNSACIQDSVVYGWAIHYFEEDSIEGTLYNEDGTEYKKVVKPTTPKTNVAVTKVIDKTKKNEGQVSIFDMNFNGDVDQDKTKETLPSCVKQAAEVNAAQDTATPIVAGLHTNEQPKQETKQPTQTQQVNSAELFYYKYELIQKQHPEHILFYRLGDFYEALGDSAEKASNVLDLTLTSRNCGSIGRLPMCGVPYHAIDLYVDKLRNKYDVALMRSDKELKLYSKKEFADIVQENAEKMDAMADEDEELGLVVDYETDEQIDGLPSAEYSKYFNLDNVTDKTTGEIKVPDVDKKLFDVLYALFDGQVIMG